MPGGYLAAVDAGGVMGHGSIRDEADGHEDMIEPALGQLVRRLIEDDARLGPADEADEIIMEIEVDGLRYLTIRCAARSAVEAERVGEPDPLRASPPAGPALSPRELEIARLVAKGYANKSIASVLDISSWTVSSHLRRIFSKLGVTSRAAMVAQLLDDGSGREPRLSRPPDRPSTWPAQGEPIRPLSRGASMYDIGSIP
jgi:DNA-binding CsgD family transcriptional regulator